MSTLGGFWWVATIGFLFADSVRGGQAEILSRDASLVTVVPVTAFEGPGCWIVNERFVATGHSISADALGTGKDRRTEREFAEHDARLRIAHEAARAQEPMFDAEAYIVTTEMSGFQTAATYKLPGRNGLFLIGIVSRNAVHVRSVFDPKRARGNALAAFEIGDYSRAARLFAALTREGVQDAETAAFARSASAHVNLAAGVTGSARTEALRLLSDFHFQRGDNDEALRLSYELYSVSATPERALLERLADLCQRTHRQNSAVAFRREIERRWPSSEKQ